MPEFVSPTIVVTICALLCLYFAWTTVTRTRVVFPPEEPISKEQLKRLVAELEIGASCRSTLEVMTTEQEAMIGVRHLYPELTQRIECWCLAGDFVLFSLDHGQVEKRAYLSVLIMKLDTNEIYHVETDPGAAA